MEFGGMGLRIQLAAADLAAHSHQGGSERRLWPRCPQRWCGTPVRPCRWKQSAPALRWPGLSPTCFQHPAGDCEAKKGLTFGCNQVTQCRHYAKLKAHIISIFKSFHPRHELPRLSQLIMQKWSYSAKNNIKTHKSCEMGNYSCGEIYFRNAFVEQYI